jgi:hypothetical protein
LVKAGRDLVLESGLMLNLARIQERNGPFDVARELLVKLDHAESSRGFILQELRTAEKRHRRYENVAVLLQCALEHVPRSLPFSYHGLRTRVRDVAKQKRSEILAAD